MCGPGATVTRAIFQLPSLGGATQLTILRTVRLALAQVVHWRMDALVEVGIQYGLVIAPRCRVRAEAQLAQLCVICGDTAQEQSV